MSKVDKTLYSHEFTWRVPTKRVGYSWEGERLVAPAGIKFHTYDPFEETCLFLMFTDLAPEPDAILGFANRFGLLGKGAVNKDGETLESWRKAIRWFNVLTSLWKASEQYDEPFIREHLHWEKEVVLCHGLPDIPCAALGDPFRLDRAALKRAGVRYKDFESAAIIFVHQALNVAMSNVAPARLFLGWDWNGENRRSILWYQASSLFGVMVAQFFDAVSLDKHFPRCQACGRFFDEDEDWRSDRTTCSDACRQKLHRMRREQALQLHAKGKEAQEIARKIRSDVETVQRWIARLNEE
jgi:hypothetical protein